MKRSYILMILIIAVLVVGWLLSGGDDTAEAPASVNVVDEEDKDGKSTPLVSNTMPVPDAGFAVEEMLVTATKEFTVSGQDFSLTPNSITVQKGDEVKIVFKNTQGFHDLTIDRYGLATKRFQSPGEAVLEFTADKTGVFQYYCSVGGHRSMGMVGKLIVN